MVRSHSESLNVARLSSPMVDGCWLSAQVSLRRPSAQAVRPSRALPDLWKLKVGEVCCHVHCRHRCVHVCACVFGNVTLLHLLTPDRPKSPQRFLFLASSSSVTHTKTETSASVCRTPQTGFLVSAVCIWP